MIFPGSMSGNEHLPLVRCMIRCVVPLLEGDNPHAAQAVLASINLLHPRCDTRKLQGLAYYRTGQYLEAMAVYAGLDDLESRAFYALCQRAVGEPSWFGVAQEVKDSGDAAAIAIIDPWLAPGFDDGAAEKSEIPELPDYPYVPLRA